MKILKLLNDIIFHILIIFISINIVNSEETVDIWNLEKNNIDPNKKIQENGDLDNNNSNILITNQNIQNSNKITINEKIDSNSDSDKIVGIYDPKENNLSIDMWTKTDGKIFNELLNKILKLNLSEDSNRILKIALLTNTYSPQKNISFEQFINF